LIQLFSKRDIEKSETGGQSHFWQNPFQDFAMKKLNEVLNSDKLQLSHTGAITQLPKINEELAREYNTESKRQSSAEHKLEVLESSLSKHTKTIESNSSANSR
jgi:uncharacterized protein with von Willebrand factor type A (vWA) domain